MDKARSLNINVQEHIVSGFKPFLDKAPVCTVEMAVDLGPLKEAPRAYSAQKFLHGQEMIILSGNFPGADRACGTGNGKLQPWARCNYSPDDSRFSDSGRGRYNEELPGSGWRGHRPVPGYRDSKAVLPGWPLWSFRPEEAFGQWFRPERRTGLRGRCR